ncbi:MAG: peptidoglycan DD-metalloendopeptidase family protein [Chloroflexi bacterium]|nr:peptidoglycan DD-metalloendopeptidase family protein [Chloroflexota bacterium]
MQHKFSPTWKFVLNLILVLGILGIALQIAHESRAVRAQDIFSPRPTLTFPGSNSLSVFTPNRDLKPFSASTIFSATLFTSQEITPTDSGGGEYKLPNVPEMTDQHRREIQQEIDRNIARLGLPRPPKIIFNTPLAFPLQAVPGLNDYGYHGMSAFVDHNSARPNQLLDWACGTRTYDTSSFNHTGTDFFTWPFGWNKMDNDQVQIVAAAPGTIVLKQDGNFDRSCGMNSNPWNGVVIRHADGSQIWYVHMKKNSVTAKSVGATVVQGEYLGIVGSSGSSTGPHLHFELRDAGGNGLDPYAGACNNISSWWSAQRPYYDSAINSLTTGNAAPVFPSCPNPETSNNKNQFNPGDTIYFTIYYRDQLAGQTTSATIFQPDGSVFRSWSGSSSVAHYSASYWYRAYALSANAPLGIWKFQVIFNGQTYTHNFSVGDALYLRGRPANRAISLDWDVYGNLPANSTWQITYVGVPGDQASPIAGITNSTRVYVLTGLTNYTWYTITLSAMVNNVPIMTDTVSVMPTEMIVDLPFVAK